MKKITNKRLVNIITIVFTLLCLLYVYYLYKAGILLDEAKMEEYIAGYGLFAPIIFILIFIFSIVFPIIPGGLLCVISVFLFGAVFGFIYSYLATILGSSIAYLLSKKYGRKIVVKIIGKEKFDKQINWLDKGDRFAKFFAFMIFIPFVPDDVLCYFAGLTKMTYKRFLILLALFKIPGIMVYSLGLVGMFEFLL